LLLNGRELEDIVLVDDKVFSYAAQLDNGIPITKWVGDPKDRALVKLKDYLIRHLKDAKDVRVVIREHYLTKLYDFV
jgi:TFIIF-interacting CTD phosphatase-like protein